MREEHFIKEFAQKHREDEEEEGRKMIKINYNIDFNILQFFSSHLLCVSVFKTPNPV
jgi:hypothetical protein